MFRPRLTVVVLLLFAAVLSQAQFAKADSFNPNGSFETGDFTGWTTIGNAQIVNSTFGVAPYAGNYQALITTGAGSVSYADLTAFLGIDLESRLGNDRFLPDLTNAYGSAIRLSNLADIGQVPDGETIEMLGRTMLLTNQGPTGHGTSAFFAELTYDQSGRDMGINYYYWNQSPPYSRFTLSATPFQYQDIYGWGGGGGSPVYSVAFVVMEAGTPQGDGLLIDDVTNELIPAPEPSSLTLLFGGIAALVVIPAVPLRRSTPTRKLLR